MKISANRVTRIDWRIGLDADEVAAHGRIDGGLNAFSSLIIHERVDPEEPDEREILALVVRDWSRGTERILYGAEDPSVRFLSDKAVLGRDVDLDAILSLGWTPRMDEQEFPPSSLVVEIRGVEAALGIELKSVKGWRARLRANPHAAVVVLRREARAEAPVSYDPSWLDGADWPEAFAEDPAEEGVAVVLP